MTRTLVLASTSPWRRQLLSRLGTEFIHAPPPFVEETDKSLPAEEMAVLFAQGKAQSLADQYPDALIIGSDQVAACEGDILRKPNDTAKAEEQLLELAGKRHSLHTAVAILDTASGMMHHEVVTVELAMRTLTPAQVARYVSLDNPVGSVGGYTIEGRGIALFESIRGGDESAIVGLPLMTVCRLLRQFDCDPLGD